MSPIADRAFAAGLINIIPCIAMQEREGERCARYALRRIE
jgi:hypothetical protein